MYRAGEIQEVVRGREDTIYSRFLLGHDEQTPDSATVEIFQPGAGESAMYSGTATITDSLVSYTREWSSSDFELWEGWRADWAIIKDGVTYTQRTWFDVCLQKFDVGVLDEHMTNYDQGCKTKQLATGQTLASFRHDALRVLRARLRTELNISPGYITRPELFFGCVRDLALAKYFFSIFKMEGDSFWEKSQKYERSSESEYRIAMSYLEVDMAKEKSLEAPRKRRFQSLSR